MSSSIKSQKAWKPEEDLDDEDLEETLSERLWGLTEMFPEGVRNAASTVITRTTTGIKGLYTVSRTVTWFLFSSSIILFSPLIFESQRIQVIEDQHKQQSQVLLGTGTAVSGGLGGMPQIQR